MRTVYKSTINENGQTYEDEIHEYTANKPANSGIHFGLNLPPVNHISFHPMSSKERNLDDTV